MLTGRNSGSVLEDELGPGIRVAELREALGLDDLRAANQPADGLGHEQIAAQIGRDAMRAHDVGARSRR